MSRILDLRCLTNRGTAWHQCLWVKALRYTYINYETFNKADPNHEENHPCYLPNKAQDDATTLSPESWRTMKNNFQGKGLGERTPSEKDGIPF